MHPSELNEKYNFSYIFNKDKIFLCDEHKEININLFQLPENWLSELEGLLQQKNGMGKHLTVYPVLEDFLKIIYHRLHGNLDDLLGPLTDSGHQQIIEKLREEIEYCSEGVYNRASQIIHSFQRPQNLSQLLFQVRQSLVEEKIAPSLTQEIHSWNLVTKTAAIEGLGVKANYVKDKYIGDDKSSLSDTQIKNALKKEFEIFFTPYHLPYLLTAQLRGLLARDGYDGLKEGYGYLLGNVEKITETIKAYLSKSCQEIGSCKFFIIDEKSSALLDLNWIQIRKYLLDSLVEDHYFIKNPTQETIVNLFDYACFIDLYPSYADLEINPEFFKKKTLYIELQRIKFEFPYFFEKLGCNSVFIDQLRVFINQLTKKLVTKDDLGLEVLKILFSLNLNNPTKNKEEFYRSIVSIQTLDKWNVLMLMAYHHSDGLTQLLNFLTANSTLNELSTLEKMFLQETDNHSNALMQTATAQPQGLNILLSFLGKHSNLFEENSFERIFLQKTKGGLNVLMLAAKHQPDGLTYLLDFLSKDSRLIEASVPQEMFLQKTTKEAWNALMLAAYHQPDGLVQLLDFLSKNSRLIKASVLQKMFLQKSKDGWNALMLAACHQPDGLTHLLDFLSKDSKLIKVDILQEMFSQIITSKKLSKELNQFIFDELIKVYLNQINIKEERTYILFFKKILSPFAVRDKKQAINKLKDYLDENNLEITVNDLKQFIVSNNFLNNSWLSKIVELIAADQENNEDCQSRLALVSV